MMNHRDLHRLILQRLDNTASSELVAYSETYKRRILEDHLPASLTPGERKWNEAVAALVEAERAHLQEILLRHDRHTMEIGSVVLFLRGFERLLELVGPLPRKEAPVAPKEGFERLLEMVAPVGVFKWTLLSSGTWRATSTIPVKLGEGIFEVVNMVYHPKLMVYTKSGELQLPGTPLPDFSMRPASVSLKEIREILFNLTGLLLDPHPILEAKDPVIAWRLLSGGPDVEIWELLWEEYRVTTTAWADSLHVFVRSRDGTQFRTWETKVSSDYKTRRRLFDEMRAWLRDRNDSTQIIAVHPVYESGC